MADWVLEIIRTLGYVGLALVLLVENLFPPIPSEIVLPLAGFLVGSGELNYWGAVFAATLGAVAGAWILYAMGLWGGRPVILRYGKYLWISAEELDRAESWFKRYGDWVVLVARVIPLARSIVSVPAGTMRMPPVRFTVLTTIGAFIWNIILVQAGVILGENWEQVSGFMGTYSNFAYVAIAAVCVYLVVKVVTHYRD
ncbi:DedA family protein [Rubrobacter indicoceani]|uniref:DedA family protein n=1 Tax=Rubrobacter indicoceani TaxID=2051957 RepID=UPI000E5B9758|nr:DedA family protein [Rubrobacter indicoceani]